MTATAFLIVSETGRVVGVRAGERAASSVAERIGARVAAHLIGVGERVSFTWQGWPKTGTVVQATGSKVVVSFALASGTTTKSMSVEKLSFRKVV